METHLKLTDGYFNFRVMSGAIGFKHPIHPKSLIVQPNCLRTWHLQLSTPF